MKGAHVLMHGKEKVTAEQWKALQPKVQNVPPKQRLQGGAAQWDEKSGQVRGALEAENLKVLGASGGTTEPQNMSGFKAGRWSGYTQLFWRSAKPGDRLELEIPVATAVMFQVIAALTMARDYAIVQCLLDDQPLGDPLDLYNYPDVVSSGEVTLGSRALSAGAHRLVFEIKGANPSAVKAHLFGLDYLRLAPK